MSTIPQNEELLKHLFEILEAHRRIFTQTRVYNRAVALLLSELMVFTRHTITQQLIALGLTEADWSAWYRLFSERNVLIMMLAVKSYLSRACCMWLKMSYMSRSVMAHKRQEVVARWRVQVGCGNMRARLSCDWHSRRPAR
ncbi:MAG: hypothetical protein Q9P01_04555, partial [Anaerolineae bacterium]|nr:hypothetical protein [Anaerolineae bacterium]